VASKGSFTLAVSGGSMVKMFASLVGRQDIDFGKW
jgi:6-phosphogluconolactonase/glucosamine-6-phosphate isomerase/deaminase